MFKTIMLLTLALSGTLCLAQPQDTEAMRDFAVEPTSEQTVVTTQPYDRAEHSLGLAFFGAASDASQYSENEVNLGFGAFVNYQYDELIAFETGAIYLDKHYDIENNGISVLAETNRLHIPLMVRVSPFNFLSVGLGPYASFRVSDEKQIFRGDTYSDAVDGSKDVEFGLDAAAALIATIDDQTGLFVEGRYSYNFDQAQRDRIENNAIYLAGLRVQF